MLTKDNLDLALNARYNDNKDENGNNGLARNIAKNRLAKLSLSVSSLIRKSLKNRGYVQPRLISTAVTVNIDLIEAVHENINHQLNTTTVIPIRGAISQCQQFPPCLDLAC